MDKMIGKITEKLTTEVVKFLEENTIIGIVVIAILFALAKINFSDKKLTEKFKGIKK